MLMQNLFNPAFATVTDNLFPFELLLVSLTAFLSRIRENI